MIRRLALFLPLLAASGCDCGRKLEPLPKPRAAPVRRLPLRGVKEVMRQMLPLVEDMRRRAIGRVGMEAPATRVAADMRAATKPGFPPDFRARSEALSQAFITLSKTKAHKKDFNEVVQRCIGCHQVFATEAAVKQVQPLLLP